MAIAKIENGRVVQIDRTTDIAPPGWMPCLNSVVCGMVFDGFFYSNPPADLRDLARAEIARLEATITPRRAREAILTDAGRAWLANVESLIAIERAKL